MQGIEELLGLDEDRRHAVARFATLHSGDDLHNVAWSIPHQAADEPSLKCECGATLHLGKDVYVEVQPVKLKWGDLALQKSIAEGLLAAAKKPNHISSTQRHSDPSTIRQAWRRPMVLRTGMCSQAALPVLFLGGL